MVELFDHRTVEGVCLTFTLPFLIWVFRQCHIKFLYIFLEKVLASSLNRCVHKPGCVIQEKRFFFLIGNERKGIFSSLISRKSLCIQAIGIVNPFRSEITHAIWFHGTTNTEIVSCPIESNILWLWEGVVIDCDMPFPGMSCDVASIRKRTSNRVRFFWHAAAEPR